MLWPDVASIMWEESYNYYYYVEQSSLATLVSLDLYNCPVTSLQEYRSQVFQLLPSLKSLDGLNEKGDEVESEGEEEEEEGDSEGGDEDDDDEPGLDYLLNNDLRSVSSTMIIITSRPLPLLLHVSW